MLPSAFGGRDFRLMRHLAAPAAGIVLAAVLAGCGTDTEPSEDPTSQEPAAPSETEESPTGERVGAEEAFLAWLEASRVPDTAEACAAMTDELVDRMIAEMEAEGFPGVESCESMIEVSADLYQAFGSSADVTVDVQEETDTEAVLFVTYLDSGDCGTVAMSWQEGRWMLTEQSEECAGY